KGAEFGGVADEDVEPAVAFVKRRGQLVDLDELAQVERHQRRLAAGRAHLVVNLLEAADRAPDQHHMGAFRGKALGHRGADPAGGAGYERDPAPKALRHYLAGARRAITASAMMLK